MNANKQAQIEAYRSSFVGEGAERHEVEGGVYFTRVRAQGGFELVAFAGRAKRPCMNYWYRSREQRDEAARRFTANLAYSAAKKAAEREARKTQGRGLEIGDVLVSCWGYEQTNVDFYEVVALVGTKTVELRPIEQHRTDTGYRTGDAMPARGQYIGEDVIRKQACEGSVRLSGFQRAYKWNGKPVFWSSYY